jgi:aryl-alcohol dehydrogenase-like predicted oxidoreductase
LKRLQTDHIDLYQLHGGTIDDPIDEVIEAFERLQQQGKIRYYGISSIRPNVIREYVKRSAITCVMLQYSVADRRPEELILDLLKKNGIGVLCRGALAQGMLAGKPGQEYLGHAAEEMDAAAQLLQGLGIPTRTGAQSALLYVLNHPAVTSVITGVSRMEQLTEIAASADKEMLTEKDLEMLKNILPPKTYELHR